MVTMVSKAYLPSNEAATATDPTNFTSDDHPVFYGNINYVDVEVDNEPDSFAVINGNVAIKAASNTNHVEGVLDFPDIFSTDVSNWTLLDPENLPVLDDIIYNDGPPFTQANTNGFRDPRIVPIVNAI